MIILGEAKLQNNSTFHNLDTLMRGTRQRGSAAFVFA